jgi:hypothetical protein
MSLFWKFFGKRKAQSNEPSNDRPPPKNDELFMEYPSDDYESSLQAMTSAFKRLKTGGLSDRWIIFGAQGRGHDEDSDQSEEVRVRDCTFDLRGQKLEVQDLLRFGELQGQVQVQVDPEGLTTLPGATPEQLARFLDAVFRKHFGIHSHEGQHDYAVGAEW